MKRNTMLTSYAGHILSVDATFPRAVAGRIAVLGDVCAPGSPPGSD